jgi:hypothetical protein
MVALNFYGVKSREYEPELCFSAVYFNSEFLSLTMAGIDGSSFTSNGFLSL